MEAFSLPSIPLDATPLVPLVHSKPTDGWHSVPTYLTGTNEWIPTYVVQLGGDRVTINCQLKPNSSKFECICRISHESIGNLMCDGGRATIPWGKEPHDCRIFIAPEIVGSIQSTKSSGGWISRSFIKRFCYTWLRSGTNLVIPVGSFGKKPHQKALGYYYTPTWMVDAPEWAFPMYSVGPNLWAVCKGHLKESQLSCDCTILGKDKNPVMYCPSRNSVPLSGPLDVHKSQHCELYLPMDETKILAFKTKEDRSNLALASNDMDWPCWATKLLDPPPVINKPSTSSKELDIARILLEFADEGRTLSSADIIKGTPKVVSEKHSSKADSDIPTESAAARSDTTLRTLRMQQNDLIWKAKLNAKADKLEDSDKRADFIEMETKRHQNSIRNRKYRPKKQAKADRLSVASGKVGRKTSGTHEPIDDVEEWTPSSFTEPLTDPSRSRDSSLDSLGKDLSKDFDPSHI